MTHTVESLMALARDCGQIERRACIGKAQGFDVRNAYSELESAFREALAPVGKLCPGIPRKGCNYLALCESVCNKCGQLHAVRFLEDVPVGAPVAWQERQQLSNGGAWTSWYECSHRPIDAPRQSLLGGIPIEWRPLYTHPSLTLTDEQIAELSYSCANEKGPRIDHFKFARAVLAAAKG